MSQFELLVMNLTNYYSYITRKTPNFIIIGVQKGGTSSLHYYLNQHPSIQMSKIKEVHYFDLNFNKSIAWYKAHFPYRSPLRKVLTGESTPYYIFHPLVPQRLHKTYPKIKLIVLLRDPIERAYSHYKMQENRKFDLSGSFQEAIDREKDRLQGEYEKLLNNENYNSTNYQRLSYLERGKYAEQLRRWFIYFQKEQFLFLRSEDFFNNPITSLQKVYAFLGVEEIYPNDLKIVNQGKYSDLEKGIRIALKNYYRSDQEELSKLLGNF